MSMHLNVMRSAVAVSLVALAAACGGGSSTNDQSNASTNMQNPAASAEAMPTGPFGQSEMQMHERMTAATGANASETWVRKMIEHHRGAVAMSQVLINGGGEPGFVQMARADAEKQQREIAELERMLARGITGGTGEPNPYGQVDQRMHQQMMAATGANLSETWAHKMIAHHQGAVDMSEVLIRQGGNPQVLAMARRTAQEQSRDIAHLEAMLRGEAMPTTSAPAAPAAPAAKAAPKAAEKETPRPTTTRTAREPSPAPKAAPARRPAQPKQATPRPAPTPESTPPATPTCLPEHRALGHC